MERLTYWNNKKKGSALPVAINDDGDIVDLETLCAKLAAYEDTGLEPSEIPTGLELANVFAAMQELKRYKDAEGQGLHVRLPCKVGETIFYIGFGYICEYEVECIDIHKDKIWIVIEICYEDRHGFWADDFGKALFLTREAAEAALAEVTDTAK